jgi:transcriptional regulator with XRE-family HTH domain
MGAKISENGLLRKNYFVPNIQIRNPSFDKYSYMDYLARRLADEMKRKDWGQEKLAKTAKVSQSTINRILNEGADPRIGTLLKISGALDIPVEYLTIEDETKALLCLQIARMDQEEIRETLLHLEKEKLYKEAKKVSQ